MDAVTPINLPTFARDLVVDELEYDPGDSVKGVTVDLNRDGRLDYLVQSAPSLCGNGGCVYLVVDGRRKEVLGQLFGEPLYIQAEDSHGFPTITSYAHMSAASGSYTSWTFDGQEYRQTSSRQLEGASLDSVVVSLKRIPVWRPGEAAGRPAVSEEDPTRFEAEIRAFVARLRSALAWVRIVMSRSNRARQAERFSKGIAKPAGAFRRKLPRTAWRATSTCSRRCWGRPGSLGRSCSLLDSLHMTRAGYLLWRRLLAPVMR